MDKYEFRIKTDQIKKLVQQRDYKAALKTVETIEWTKVKNMSMLTVASEVYEKNGRYEESLDILLLVYERYPASRTVVYKLAELYIQIGEFDEAVHFYQEYVKIAPYDTSKYILKYKICKGKGQELDKLIGILEELKSQDYHEEWAYELARLYHHAGRIDECVAECDEIDLWFGEGYYVTKALELKMHYQPLTPVQMRKYEDRYAYLEEAEGLAEVDLDGKEDAEFKVKTFTMDQYNTANLQAELAKSIEQLLMATDKESLDSTMEVVKKLVEESHIPNIEPPKPINYEEILAADEDGQISLYVPEENLLEKQITGQMTIEDVLKEWEKTKESAERAIEESKARHLERARSHALEETGNIMERLKDVLPVSQADQSVVNEAMEGLDYLDEMEEFGEEPEEDEVQWAGLEEEAEELPETLDEEEEDLLFEEVLGAEPEDDESVEYGELTDMDIETAPTVRIPDLEVTKEWVPSRLPLSQEEEEEENEFAAFQDEGFEIPEITFSEMEEVAQAEESLEQETFQAEGSDSEAEDSGTEEAPSGYGDTLADTEEDFEIPEITFTESEEDMEPEKAESEEIKAETEDTKEEKRTEEKPAKAKDKPEKGSGFTSEQKEILSYFMDIPKVKEVLEQVGKDYASSSFILISGMEGSGRASLATRLIKAAQMAPDSVGRKIAKTTGSSLNQKNISQVFEKMAQGSLVVEQAEELSQETLETLYQEMKKYQGRLQVYFLGRTKPLTASLQKNEPLYQACKHKIQLPVYSNDDLVAFARAYARSQKYAIGDMGILALYTRIGARQTQSHKVTLGEVKEILDEAIANSSKFTPKKFFGKLFATHINEEGLIILNERDFQEKEEL